MGRQVLEPHLIISNRLYSGLLALDAKSKSENITGYKKWRRRTLDYLKSINLSLGEKCILELSYRQLEYIINFSEEFNRLLEISHLLAEAGLQIEGVNITQEEGDIETLIETSAAQSINLHLMRVETNKDTVGVICQINMQQLTLIGNAVLVDQS